MWIFLATDAVLLGAACAIGAFARKPWSETTIMAVVVSAIAGACVLIFWLMAFYERQKNEVLDDRQRALEALARTVSSSAEQISIAAAGLHEIADTAQKNMKLAEQLPHKLQEKIAEFQAQLSAVNDEEREELEKELEELRGSETERLQSTFDRIAKTSSEFVKVEAAIHQHVTAANEAIAKLSSGTTDAIGKARTASEQALAQARQEAARTITDAASTAMRSIESAKAAAIAELAGHFDMNVRRVNEAVAQLTAATEQLRNATAAAPAIPAKVSAPASSSPGESVVSAPANPADHPEVAETVAPAGKRNRKPKREEPVPAPEVPQEPSTANSEPISAPSEAASSTAPAEPIVPPVEAVDTTPPEATPALEQPPVDTPVTPPTAAVPASSSEAQAVAADSPAAPAAAESVSQPAPLAEPPKAPRKRAPRRHEDEQPGLGLEIEEHKNGSDGGDGSGAASGVIERVLTSDGATRLVVTAYIGIGNRLFIRGNGPGLSWEKGVPLQFVSIGKWRWETSEATGPVQFKLLKNDEQECAGLGALSIEPGHQNEVTAAF